MLLNAVALLSCVLLVSSKPYHGYDQPDYTLAKHQPAVSNKIQVVIIVKYDCSVVRFLKFACLRLF